MRTIFKIFFLLFAFVSTAQVDTIIHQNHQLQFTTTNKKSLYLVDKKEVTKSEYEKAKKQNNNITDCKPCWLRTFDKKGDLLYEGDFYQDCCIGKYILRYSNGNLKLKGQCKPDKTACFTKQGEWIYYKINGDIEKTEIYKEGELVK